LADSSVVDEAVSSVPSVSNLPRLWAGGDQKK
jgi:hypothetical protein